MPRIFVTGDADDTTRVEVMAIDDPTSPGDDDEPFYAAQCRTPGCAWNSFADDNSIFIYQIDAVHDAEVHVDQHAHAEA